jgi:hypothetical protein
MTKIVAPLSYSGGKQVKNNKKVKYIVF